MLTIDRQIPKPARARRMFAVVLGSAVLAAAVPAAAFAKEIGSGAGGGVVTPAACNPVTSLTAKGDATTGETGLATISVSYNVKPCTNGQSVIVDTKVYETAAPAAVSYDNPAAALSGKFVAVARVRVSYTVKVTVFDAVTGIQVGTLSVFAAAVPKPV